jgi:hypothetical protein
MRGASGFQVWLLINVSVVALGFVSSCLKWGFLLFRSEHILALLTPLWTVYILALVARRCIFMPLDTADFNERWSTELAVVLGLACFILPFYGPIRRVVHLYYRYSLRKAFYKDGQDIPLNSALTSPLCPNLVISATLVDYCRLSDIDKGRTHFSEFFLTPRWMGSERTGFIRTPTNLSAGKAMAISGAASDAFLMTKMNKVWVRATFLALFNLFMGDYVTFSTLPLKGDFVSQLQAFVVLTVFVLFLAAMYTSHWLAMRGSEDGDCRLSSGVFWAAWGMLLFVVSASFFAFHGSCRWLLSSPLIRHIHTATMHYHTSPEPPLKLFLNDGGLIECLGLISLLRRRCRWMLVTDASADFCMEMVCLRDSMQMARDERLCSFFDPDNPLRGVEPLMEDFRNSKEACLRIGVLYDCWDADYIGERRCGEIFFVRMRLIDDKRVGCQRITKSEVVDGVQPEPDSTGGVPQMLRHELGGCCCDCCHAACNCGMMGRFPDISNGNQFLTPTQFALLCRLGFELSGRALDQMELCQEQQGNVVDPVQHYGSPAGPWPEKE